MSFFWCPYEIGLVLGFTNWHSVGIGLVSVLKFSESGITTLYAIARVLYWTTWRRHRHRGRLFIRVLSSSAARVTTPPRTPQQHTCTVHRGAVRPPPPGRRQYTARPPSVHRPAAVRTPPGRRPYTARPPSAQRRWRTVILCAPWRALNAAAGRPEYRRRSLDSQSGASAGRTRWTGNWSGSARHWAETPHTTIYIHTGWSINNRTILNCSHFLARRYFFDLFSPKGSIHTGKLPQQHEFANASFFILFRCHFVSPYHVDGSTNTVLCRGGHSVKLLGY